MRSKLRAGSISALVASLALSGLMLASVVFTSPARADALTLGVQWQALTLDQALEEAAKTGRKVLVEVWAEHCAACKEMATDVWATPDGVSLTSNAIAIRIDSTTPEGQELSKRYPVLGLPLSLYLNEDGTEFDRVTGYDGARDFMLEATPMSQGIDALPRLEKDLAAQPNNAVLMLPVLEKYLGRKREADAQKMMERIFAADPQNAAAVGERAIGLMARYVSYYKGDHAGAFAQWKSLVDRYPNASSVSGAVDGAYKAAASMGGIEQWKSWLCETTKKQPKNGQLQQAAALAAYRYKVMDPCFGAAARAAIALGMKSPNLESVAKSMEGTR